MHDTDTRFFRGDRMDGGEIEPVESTPVGDKALGPAQLEWTGERFVPEVTGDVALEHVHRYLMAREMARDRVVLDIASGEGYGSALLAEVARKVVGVDLSPEAVEHAARQYTRYNLHFALGSCSEIPLPDSSIDLAVSFETIEHHNEHESMMQELKRVLRPRGKLIISSPDKYEYADRAGHHNPFHVKELYRHEFEDLVKRYFTHTAFYGQRVLYGSTILREDGATRIKSHQHQDGQAAQTTRPWTPMYWIAVASDVRLRLGVSSVLNKPLEDIVRESEQQLAARERDVHELNFRTAELQQRIGGLGEQVEERDHQIRQLTDATRVRDLRTSELNGALAERSRRVHELTQAAGEREQRIRELAAAVYAREKTIEDLTQAVSARDERVQELGEALAARDDRVATLSRTISRREHQMGALKEETRLHGVRVNKFRDDALAASSLREQVRVFENSKSWRFTAPLRATGQLVRRIRHFFQPGPSLLVRNGVGRGANGSDHGANAPESPVLRKNSIRR